MGVKCQRACEQTIKLGHRRDAVVDLLIPIEVDNGLWNVLTVIGDVMKINATKCHVIATRVDQNLDYYTRTR